MSRHADPSHADPTDEGSAGDVTIDSGNLDGASTPSVPAPEPSVPQPAPEQPALDSILADEPTADTADTTDTAGPPEVPLGPTGRPYRQIPDPAPLDKHGPATVIAICNQKGGVGKTTTTINLGAALAECGRRVLLVDLDPQGALSAGLGVPHHELDATVHNLLVPPQMPIDEVLMRTRVDGLDLLPSNIDLSAAEIQLVTEVGREQSLARALHPVLDRYDFVLIDCQPSLGLLTVNALACADSVLIPMECAYFSLRGLALLNDTVNKVRDRLNPKLKLSGILVTMFDSRTLHAREVMERVVEVFGDVVFDSVVNRTVRFPETSVAGEPIISWAPKSAGAAAYRALAREVIARDVGLV
jgi:chromosome partitioning protein